MAWLVLTVTLVFHHEPWRDEADGWLATRDATPAQLLRFTNYVGVPGLWFWLQFPLARLGLPYVSLGLLNLVFAAAAVALVLWRAPFPWPVRLGIAFGYFASYEYAAIARSYALAMALVLALAAFDDWRRTRPVLYGALLALLFNTNIHGGIVAGAVLATFAWEALGARGPAQEGASDGARPAVLGGLAVAMAGAVLMVIQLWPPPDGQLTGFVNVPDWSLVTESLGGAFFPTAEHSPLAAPLAWITLGLVVIDAGGRPRAVVALLVAAFGLWALFLFKYAGDLRHWGFLLLASLYAWWVARAAAPERRRTGPFRLATIAALLLSCAWSVWTAAEFWRRDLRDPFSGSKGLARWLVASRLVDLPIAAWPAAHAESILPYLPGKRFFDPGTGRTGTYMKWDRACVEGFRLDEPEVVRRAAAAFGDRDALLIANQPMASAEAAGFRLVHTEIGPVMMGDEQYFVYRRGSKP